MRRVGPAPLPVRQPLDTLSGHRRQVNDLLWLDADRLVSTSEDGSVRLWGPEPRVLIDGRLPFNCFARDDRTFVLGGDDGTVRVFDRATCEPVARLEGHTAYIRGVAVRDGLIASACEDKTARLWRDGACIAVLEGHRNRLSSVAILEDGTIATASYDNAIYLWDADGNKIGELYDAGATTVFSGSWYLGGTNDTGEGHRKPPHFLVAGDGLWSFGEEMIRWEGSEQTRCVPLPWSPDGVHVDEDRVVLTHQSLHVYDGDGAHVLGQPLVGGHGSTALAVFGDKAAVGRRNGTIQIYDVSPYARVGHPGFVGDVKVTRSHAYSSDSDNVVLIWDLQSGECRGAVRRMVESGTRAFDVDPDGILLVQTHSERPPQLEVNGADGTHLRNVALEHEDRQPGPHALAVLRGGERAVVGYLGDHLMEWDLTGNDEHFVFEGYTRQVGNIHVDPDEQRVVLVGYFEREDAPEPRPPLSSVTHVQVFDRPSRRLLWTAPADMGDDDKRIFVSNVAISSDAVLSDSTARDGQMQLRDAETGEVLHDLVGDALWMAPHEDGFLAVVAVDGGWDLVDVARTGITRTRRLPVEGDVHRVAATARILAVTTPTDVVLLDLPGLEETERWPLDEPDDRVRILALSPDADRVVLGLQSGRVVVLHTEA